MTGTSASLHGRQRLRSLEQPVFQVSGSSWIWVAAVPFLPDVGRDRDQVEDPWSALGYRALAESLATTAPSGTAVQIRLLGSGSQGGGVVQSYIVGRSRSEATGKMLGALVRATLPAEIPLRPLNSLNEVAAILGHIDVADQPLSAVGEIRRRVEELDLVPGMPRSGNWVTPGVLRWGPDPHGLRTAATILARHSTRACIILHMEATTPSVELLTSLEHIAREVAAGDGPAENPLRRQVAMDDLRRLRNLPRAALEVRVMVSADHEIEPGLAEAIGISLCADEAFTIVQPQTDIELLLASELATTATARWWGSTGDSVIDELLRTCDCSEAASVVRLPAPLRSGTPGLASVPLSTLPRSASSNPGPGPAVYIGQSPGGGSGSLSLEEINRHLLVCGLPGFGKTLTTQRILARLWTEHGIPFLVIDPAKSDYDMLADDLGADAVHITLSQEATAFNPFAPPAGVSGHTFAARVLAAFDSTLGLSNTWPLGYVTLARGIFTAFEDAADGPPTLRSIYASVGDTLRRTALAGPDGANARAALLSRLEFLAKGPLGSALIGDTSAGADWARMMKKPTIIELRHFSGPVERSLVFALLLAGLISHRERHPSRDGLGHVTVLEEAHRVLRRTEGESEGVRLFVEAIAELRGSGEGFIIVDQAPTRLHDAVMKLTGSIFAHRLVDPVERALVGSAVLLDERQQQDLARLGTGQGVLFSSSRVGSVVVEVDPSLPPDLPTGEPLRRDVLSHTGGRDLPFCFGCRYTCLHHYNARRLNAQFPTPVGPPDHIAEHFRTKTVDSGLVRCAAAMSQAQQWDGPLPDFLVWLRQLEDHLPPPARASAPPATPSPAIAPGELTK